MTRQRLALAHRDRGESLLELIITIMIMGITIPAVVGAVLASVGSSSQDRRQIQAQQLITSWSETIAKANTDATYTEGSCPATTFYASGAFAPTALPSGFHPSVVSITYWNAVTGAFDGSACATEKGIRQVRLRIDVDAGVYPGFSMDRYVIVRKPCVSC